MLANNSMYIEEAMIVFYILIGSIVLFFAANKVFFNVTVWKLKTDLGKAKYKQRRIESLHRKAIRQRNILAIEIIGLRSFKKRFISLLKTTKRKNK